MLPRLLVLLPLLLPRLFLPVPLWLLLPMQSI
jgi:hypothetical protein